MRVNWVLVVGGVCFMSAAGFAAQVELGLTAVDHGVPAAPATQSGATTQPDATPQADGADAKKPPQLGLGPTAEPAAPAVATRVIVEQRVVRVRAGRRAR